jgi:hypothetical protein
VAAEGASKKQGNAAAKQRGRRISMISNLSLRAREGSDTAGLAPWSVLISWGVFVPAVFVGNVVLAIFAWFVVEWAMTLI